MDTFRTNHRTERGPQGQTLDAVTLFPHVLEFNLDLDRRYPARADGG